MNPIHLTRLAKTARQSAVLEERNQLAAEIHDALAQSFTGISMQLGVAGEQLAAKQGDPLRQIQRANEIAKFGLAEARRSILSLSSSAIEESGLTATLQRLVEHSNVAAQLRCDFRSDNIPEERLPPRIQHELLRFAQEAISNAVRHAKPTVVTVTLRWEPPNLLLKVTERPPALRNCQESRWYDEDPPIWYEDRHRVMNQRACNHEERGIRAWKIGLKNTAPSRQPFNSGV